jgi:hypothetical protein
MKMRKRALGMSLGIVWGVFIFWVTLWAAARGHGHTLSLLKGYYLGYSVSYVGAMAGLGWGFVHGFIGGVLIAFFYNFFSRVFYGSVESP